jgi:hypothetical protein
MLIWKKNTYGIEDGSNNVNALFVIFVIEATSKLTSTLTL